MRLNVAWTLAVAGLLQHAKNHDAAQRAGGAGSDRLQPLRPSKDREQHAQRIPAPAIAQPRGADHPKTNPARRTPPVHALHQLMVSVLDKMPDPFCDGHANTSWHIQSKRSVFFGVRPFRTRATSADHFRANFFSAMQLARLAAGISIISGAKQVVHRFSRIISRESSQMSR